MKYRLLQQALTILALFFLVGCSHVAATPVPTATPLAEGPVKFEDGSGAYCWSGTLYGRGETAVILAGRGGAPESEWEPVAKALAAEGFTALTIFSVGSKNDVLHVECAIGFLRDNGFRHIVCIGASSGAYGCSGNATKPEMIGLVLVTYHSRTDLSKVTYPKLFVAGEQDSTYRPLTERAYEAAAEPKELVIVPESGSYGPLLLYSKHGQELTNTIVDFVKGCSGQ